MSKGEPKQRKEGSSIDTSNLMGVRTAGRGTDLEVQLNTPSYGSNNEKQKGHEKHMNFTEAMQYVTRVTGLDGAEAEETVKAIDRWSGSAYHAIRSVQQDGTIPGVSKKDVKTIEKFRVMGNRLERFIERAPKWDGKMTYRGMRFSKQDIAKLKVGDTINMKGTSSWSSSFDVAEDFGDKKVVVASTTQRHGTSILFHSGLPEEKEVLVSRRSNYRIKKISHMKSGTTLVWVDEV